MIGSVIYTSDFFKKPYLSSLGIITTYYKNHHAAHHTSDVGLPNVQLVRGVVGGVSGVVGGANSIYVSGCCDPLEIRDPLHIVVVPAYNRHSVRLSATYTPNLVYVPNPFCNTISEINGTTNKLNYAVTFTSDPPTGTISCNSSLLKLKNEYRRFDEGRTLFCNTDYWLGNGLYPLRFGSWSGLVNSNGTSVKLTVSRSGTLTAHFIEILPHDIMNSIYVAVLAAAGGWSLRAFAIRRREKLQERWLEIINSEYNRLSNNRDECLRRLAEIREDVMHMYADGTIPKHYFEKLDKQIARFESSVKDTEGYGAPFM